MATFFVLLGLNLFIYELFYLHYCPFKLYPRNPIISQTYFTSSLEMDHIKFLVYLFLPLSFSLLFPPAPFSRFSRLCPSFPAIPPLLIITFIYLPLVLFSFLPLFTINSHYTIRNYALHKHDCSAICKLSENDIYRYSVLTKNLRILLN